MYFERIIDANTGNETIREYTEAEVAEAKKNEAESKAYVENLLAKDKARQSALSKLIDLGLTEEEIAAL